MDADTATTGATDGPDAGMLTRLLVAVPGFVGAAYIIQQGWVAYAAASHESSLLPAADQRENVAGGLAMGVGQALMAIGLFVASLVVAAVLPRRLSAWLAAAVLVPGLLMLAYGLVVYAETGDGKPLLAVAFAPAAAVVRLIWQGTHKTKRAA